MLAGFYCENLALPKVPLPNWICVTGAGVGTGVGVGAMTGAQDENGLIEGDPESQVTCILNESDALPK